MSAWQSVITERECPRCGALPGVSCTALNGGRVVMVPPHPERFPESGAVALCHRNGCGRPPTFIVRTGSLARFICGTHLSWQIRRMIAVGSWVEVGILKGDNLIDDGPKS